MTTLDADGIESITAIRKDDEYGMLELRISCEDGTYIVINAGRFQDDAETLHDLLKDAAEAFKSSVLDGWEDRPDQDDDGFVYENDYRDGGGYTVYLSGSQWSDGVLHARNDRSNWRALPFPTRDIAEYELCAAMTESGYFPNLWYMNERGNTDSIYESARKYHDAGGTDLVPLEGVTFEEGADVVHDGRNATIVKDYGTELGVVFHYDYEDRKDVAHTTDRDELLPYVEEEESEG